MVFAAEFNGDDRVAVQCGAERDKGEEQLHDRMKTSVTSESARVLWQRAAGSGWWDHLRRSSKIIQALRRRVPAADIRAGNERQDC